jgi:ribosomal-protein-alanine N-acetyltransferase
MIFQTERLKVRPFKETDLDLLFEIMSNPIVMDALPRPVKTKSETEITLEQFIRLEKTTSTKWWCITTKSTDNLIGLCGFKENEKNEPEIGYCFNEQYWGYGYGTEIAKGLLYYGFNQLKFTKITADVTKTNLKSIKILEKFMKLEKEFYNDSDKCIDCRYFVERI